MDFVVGIAWIKNTVLGNEVWRFLAWLGGVLLAILIGRIVRHHLKQIAGVMERRQKPMVAVFLRAAARAMVFALVTVALDAGLHFLVLSEATEALVTTVMRPMSSIASWMPCARPGLLPPAGRPAKWMTCLSRSCDGPCK